MPLVLLLHGRGADANDLADLAPMLDGGFRFLCPNAPKPFEAYPGMTFGWTWFDGWPPVHESLVASRALLLGFIAEALERYPTPPGRFVIAGFSQGGLMALDAGLRTAAVPAGIVVMSGGLYENELPDLAGRAATPVFIGHGDADEVVSVNYARRARGVLEGAGFTVDYEEYPMGHQLVQEEAVSIRSFLSRVLGSPAGG